MSMGSRGISCETQVKEHHAKDLEISWFQARLCTKRQKFVCLNVPIRCNQ